MGGGIRLASCPGRSRIKITTPHAKPRRISPTHAPMSCQKSQNICYLISRHEFIVRFLATDSNCSGSLPQHDSCTANPSSMIKNVVSPLTAISSVQTAQRIGSSGSATLVFNTHSGLLQWIASDPVAD